jgi:hypothetical protein
MMMMMMTTTMMMVNTAVRTPPHPASRPSFSDGVRGDSISRGG